MKETKLPIKSIADYKRERRRLQAAIAEQELLLRSDIAQAKEMLKPINAIARIVSKFVVTDDDKSTVNKWVDTAVTFALRNVVLSRAGWLAKTFVPIIARNFANNKFEENKAEILGTLRGWLQKLQDKRHKTHTNGTTYNTHFDRSTADINL